ncbi:hypothetical protein [Sphingomonas ginsenosidivorax]|uniref:hypothetical protein n=1 Tax=Sphingomonas ginsenosidivorax TaxID=862135 RepID=UPI001F55221F|nr:hypothetical protein [Sphingomonas ginsenosidivorax]
MNKWVLVLALVIATPVKARDLGVPADKGWKHAETGLILMPQLAGLSRIALTDATQTERDVAAQYDMPDKSMFATIYLFHPAITDVALWFDRSRTAIETRDLFRNAAPASADPISFAVGNSGSAASLRQVYATPGGGQYRSTALAVVPVGEWIVSVRMSAKTLTADQLDASLQQVIQAIRWPKPTATLATATARPIMGCDTPLTFPKARQAKPNGADMLMALMASSIAAKAKSSDIPASAPPTTWCREDDGRTEYGVYRSIASTNGYVMALYDAGGVVSVYPSLMGQVDNSGTYAVSLTDVEGTVSSFPSFTAMPSPQQVWDLVKSGKRTGTMRGNQMTIDPKAL